jgi:hypothetical protein
MRIIKTHLKYSIIVVLVVFSFVTELCGQVQVITLRKEKKERCIYPGIVTIILRDGTEYSGILDSVNTNEIRIITKETGQILFDIEKIKMFKQRRHIWYIGACSSLIQVTNKYDLDKWKCTIKNRKYF